MNAARPADILRQLERADGAPDADADLLARFAATRDSDAVAELVRRHGALVFGVCRRVTGHPQDAEDAFQATFLVLARKAGAVRDAALLGNWLYGVAFRVAWRAKRSAAGRHQLRRYWGEAGGVNRQEMRVSRKVDLDLPETHGYAFAANGHSFRTVAYARPANDTSGANQNPQPVTPVEVVEVDTKTGQASKSLLKVECIAHALSRDGRRFAAVDPEAKKVTVYDLDRGTKQSEYVFPPAGPELSTVGRDVLDPRLSRVYLALSPDGRRLVVSRGFSQTYSLNADSGAVLPALEGADGARVYPDPLDPASETVAGAFGAGGRLFVAEVRAYKRKKGFVNNLEQEWWYPGDSTTTVWDVETGKVLKTWNKVLQVACNPSVAILAVFEPNGDSQTRVGLWNFAPLLEKK